MLLIHLNHIVLASRLVEALWDREPPASADVTLRTHVSHLRRRLAAIGAPGSLVTRASGYGLFFDPEHVDAYRFERLVGSGQEALGLADSERAAQMLREALQLWRGPVLEDLGYPEFAESETARLDELRLVALEARIDADLALGRHLDVITELELLNRGSCIRRPQQRPPWSARLAVEVDDVLAGCTPGGGIGMVNWTPTGFVGQLLKTVTRHVPPTPGALPPTRWGTEKAVRELLGDGISELTCSTETVTQRFPGPEFFADFFLTHYGPTRKAAETLSEEGRHAFRDDLIALATASNRATDGTVVVTGSISSPLRPRPSRDAAASGMDSRAADCWSVWRLSSVISTEPSAWPTRIKNTHEREH